MIYILILTLSFGSYTSGVGGGGGVATSEFFTKEACNSAGKAWLKKVDINLNRNTGSFYLCVEKGE